MRLPFRAAMTMTRPPMQGMIKIKAREKPRKSTTFPRGERDIDVEAAVLMNALCKPWELGGHPHDFLVAHRSARITDATQYYERDTAMITRHERMVADKVVWNRQRAIREEMLQLLTRLHSIEKQRRHFNAVRIRSQDAGDSPTARSLKAARPVYEHDANANAQILSSSFVSDRPLLDYPDSFPPHRSRSRLRSHSQCRMPVEHDEEPTKPAILSPLTVAEKKAVEELDTFDLHLEASKRKEAPGSAVSFGKGKRK